MKLIVDTLVRDIASLVNRNGKNPTLFFNAYD